MKTYPTNAERKAAKLAKRQAMTANIKAERAEPGVNPFADEVEEVVIEKGIEINGVKYHDMSEYNEINNRKMWAKR